jgi:hypothetical protein
MLGNVFGLKVQVRRLRAPARKSLGLSPSISLKLRAQENFPPKLFKWLKKTKLMCNPLQSGTRRGEPLECRV